MGIFTEFCLPPPSCVSSLKFPSASLFINWQFGTQLRTEHTGPAVVMHRLAKVYWTNLQPALKGATFFDHHLTFINRKRRYEFLAPLELARGVHTYVHHRIGANMFVRFAKAKSLRRTLCNDAINIHVRHGSCVPNCQLWTRWPWKTLSARGPMYLSLAFLPQPPRQCLAPTSSLYLHVYITNQFQPTFDQGGGGGGGGCKIR